MDRRTFIKTTFLTTAAAITGCSPQEEHTLSQGAPHASGGHGTRPQKPITRTVETPEMSRAVHRTIRAVRKREGAGFEVRRPFPTHELSLVDPFVLLDEMGPKEHGPGEALGAPDHPHRGFETVTYLVEGKLHHRDSMGHDGYIGNGGVQWMTAGRGVVHSEMPHDSIIEHGGRVHGFQLWVNLPKKLKMIEPHYQELQAHTVPILNTSDGLATARVIAGQALDVKAQFSTHTPITYQHWTLRPGAAVDFPIPRKQRASLFIFKGSALVGPKRTRVDDGSIAILGDGDVIRLAAPQKNAVDTELLLMGGEPINEPIARYGPFVMNTKEEIAQAFEDYRAGRMGQIPPRG